MRAAGCADLATYHARLIAEREEIDRLVESLVVPVTEFFRDGWVFRELAETVLPTLPAANGILRAWVVGTATGEEAYTVAMLLAEAAARQRGRGFEVLASDLDQRSEGPGCWRVVDSIRGRVHFAQHDLTIGCTSPRVPNPASTMRMPL